MTTKQFVKFVERIRNEGIKEPICYVEHGGKKYVVNGDHRLRAAKILELSDVPIKKASLPYKGYHELSDLLGYYGR